MRILQTERAAIATVILVAMVLLALAVLVLPGRAFAREDDGAGPAPFRINVANVASDQPQEVVEAIEAPQSRPILPAASAPAPAATAVAVPPAVNDAGLGGCPAIIANALGRAGCMISFCESSWNPNTTGAQGERGYFQIHPAYHADSTYDPAGNVAAAVRISNNGTNWGAWTVRSVLSTGVCPGGLAYPG